MQLILACIATFLFLLKLLARDFAVAFYWAVVTAYWLVNYGRTKQ